MVDRTLRKLGEGIIFCIILNFFFFSNLLLNLYLHHKLFFCSSVLTQVCFCVDFQSNLSMSYHLLSDRGSETRGSLVWLTGVLCSPTRLPLAICLTAGTEFNNLSASDIWACFFVPNYACLMYGAAHNSILLPKQETYYKIDIFA